MHEGFCKHCKYFNETSNHRKRCCKYHKEIHSDLAYGYTCFASNYSKPIICGNCKHLENNDCKHPVIRSGRIKETSERGCYQWEEGEDKNNCRNCRYIVTENIIFVCNNKTVLDNIPKGHSESFNADDPDCGQWRSKRYCIDCKWNGLECRALKYFSEEVVKEIRRYDNSCSLWYPLPEVTIDIGKINQELLEETRKLFE